MVVPEGIAAMMNANKKALGGVRVDQVLEPMETIVFFEEGMERAAWHVRQGHGIVLVSGMLEPLAHMVAIALECELEARGVGSRGACVCHTDGRTRWKVDGAFARRSDVWRGKSFAQRSACGSSTD